jgi:uncharacterized protein YjbI with pentapeptide repeats
MSEEEKVDQIDLDQLTLDHARQLKGLADGARLFLNFRNCTGLDFARKDLSWSEMVGSRLNQCDFSEARLVGANLEVVPHCWTVLRPC